MMRKMVAAGIRQPTFERRAVIVLTWSVAVICLWLSFGTNSPSTDDATRLVEIRDLLAGQSWFDHTQYRLNPSEGVVTHWSRLLDLPIALLIKAAEMIVPTALAYRHDDLAGRIAGCRLDWNFAHCRRSRRQGVLLVGLQS
jgi:hypothetical protein